jgi:hypothetical protein
MNPAYWDFGKNEPKPQCLNRDWLEILIAERTKTYTEKILELTAMRRDFTAKSLIEKVNTKNQLKNIGDMF